MHKSTAPVHRAGRGFTLIEMLLAISVAGLLSGIAYPSFQGVLHQVRRADAYVALLQAQAAQERWRANHREYGASLAEIGAPYFQSYCASCHGMSGRGDGPAAASLRTPPADLTRIAARRGGKFPEGEIAQFIDGRFTMAAHGTREMPAWGAILEIEHRGQPPGTAPSTYAYGRISELLVYLESIQQR